MKTIQRTNVSSSNLQSVGYDFDNQILEIEFKDGSIYQYPNVPYHLYQGLMNTNSHGSYFWKYIRNKFNEYQIY